MNISVNFLNEIWKYESNQNLWQQLLRRLKLWIIYQIKLASIWQKLVWVVFPLSTPLRNSSGPQVNWCWECQISANFQERGHEEHFADIWPEIRYLPSTYWPASHFAISSISFCICICVFSFYLNSRFCFFFSCTWSGIWSTIKISTFYILTCLTSAISSISLYEWIDVENVNFLWIFKE